MDGITWMAVKLLEFVSQGLAADVQLEIVKGLGHWQLTITTPFVVAGQSVITTSLNIQRGQILSHQVGGSE